MISKSFPPLVVLSLVIIQVACQVPGAAEWTASLSYYSNSSSSDRYAYIPQSLTNQEWTNLGTTFTIEAWFKINAFKSNSTGAWLPSYTSYNESQYIPLIVRHPGNGFPNQWAHFMIQVTRGLNGMYLSVYSGCGCAVPPQLSGGIQANVSTCGYGYNLATAPGSLLPETWYHVAVSFDGDNTDMSKTRQAVLYLNGVQQVTNTWGNPANQPLGYNSNACANQPMQWFRSSFQMMGNIMLGYLNNQDFVRPTGAVVNDLNPAFDYYGLSGNLDEIRIWRVARTATQIANNFDCNFSPAEASDPNLVAYYTFNSVPLPPSTGSTLPQFANDKNSNGPTGTVVVNTAAPSLSPYFFWASSLTQSGSGLTVNYKIPIDATLPATPRMIVNMFSVADLATYPATPTSGPPVLAGSYQNFTFIVNAFSPALSYALQNGSASLVRSVTGAGVGLATEFNSGDSFTLVVRCVDTMCSNLLVGTPTPLASFPFRSFYLNYTIAFQPSQPAFIFFNVYPDCDGIYDACGVCNGDNRTCQCVVYHEFKNIRMSYVLLTFMVDFLIDKVTATTQILDETLTKVNGLIATSQPIPLASSQTSQLMTFYNGCLTNYCQSVTRFLSILTSLPQ